MDVCNLKDKQLIDMLINSKRDRLRYDLTTELVKRFMAKGVVDIGVKFKYSSQSDLESDMSTLISKYDGKLSLAQFIGVMDIVKHSLLTGHSEQ